MKNWKYIIPLSAAGRTVLVMCLTGTCAMMFTPAHVFAALSDYDAETAAKLQDNQLDYDELQNLIKEYNPQIKYAYDQMDFTREDTASTVRSQWDDIELNKYKDALKTAKAGLRQLEDMPDSPAKIEAVQKVKAGIVGIKMILDIPSSTTKSTDKGLESAEKNLDTNIRKITMGSQKLMVSCDSLSAQVTTLEKVEELQKASVEAAKRQQSLGMATATDVNAAESSLLSTQSQLENLRNLTDDLRIQLGLLTGWSADAMPVVGAVPAADPGKLDTIDLQADIVKAIGNNQTLISQRRGSSAKSTSAIDNRLLNLDEAEQKLKIEMERLYQDMQQKRADYNAGMTAFQKAELSKNAAERQYQLGMLGQLQYLGAQVQYLQAEGSRKSADTALFQSMLDYDWAVQGFVAIPQ